MKPVVIPANAGIQSIKYRLDPGLRRGDKTSVILYLLNK